MIHIGGMYVYGFGGRRAHLNGEAGRAVPQVQSLYGLEDRDEGAQDLLPVRDSGFSV